MITVIHDLEENVFDKLGIKADLVLSPKDKIGHCMGCFDCWLKNDGACSIPDKFNNMKDIYLESSKVIVISKNCYGMFSPFIKNIFDRSIGYISPYFRKVFGEVHHQLRYDKVIPMEYIIYGNNNDEWINTFNKLLKANQENFNNDYQVKYIKEIEELYE